MSRSGGKMEEFSRCGWMRSCCCKESEEEDGGPEEEEEEEDSPRSSRTWISIPPSVVDHEAPDPSGSQPDWFHTLQVRRLRIPRGRSNSDPLRAATAQEVFTWKAGLEFGAAQSYLSLEKLGEGAFASVYKGISRINGQLVALKVIRMKTDEGIPFTAIREASLLKHLKHANIVLLHDIIHTRETLTFVFEYVCSSCCLPAGGSAAHTGTLKRSDPCVAAAADRSGPVHDAAPRRTSFAQRADLHVPAAARPQLHPRSQDPAPRPEAPQPAHQLPGRAQAGRLRKSTGLCCAFNPEGLHGAGLARSKSIPAQNFSSEVVTLWYRPPDVLMGSIHYSTALDMWGAGCIFIEMLQGSPAFAGGSDELEQLQNIWTALVLWRPCVGGLLQVLGVPSEDSWPGVSLLPNYRPERFIDCRPKLFTDVWKRLEQLSCKTGDLAQKMLRLVPTERISAQEALQHPYFSTLPAPIMHLRDAVSIFKVPGVCLETEFRDIWNPGQKLKSARLPAASCW
ncbi:cyclin-dependent kinase 15 isoform X2 [Poecilia reticulata]|uniref:cyclin-dependent kinase 15 isoform X2 n=1 Tax=Poecilia reticulata TaxID=8081 RepID=UPI0007E92EAD|nr:PREDICTED: cyclin-dependent kinase 15-like isoform X2 [Poecilia reticulata]